MPHILFYLQFGIKLLPLEVLLKKPLFLSFVSLCFVFWVFFSICLPNLLGCQCFSLINSDRWPNRQWLTKESAERFHFSLLTPFSWHSFCMLSFWFSLILFTSSSAFVQPSSSLLFSNCSKLVLCFSYLSFGATISLPSVSLNPYRHLLPYYASSHQLHLLAITSDRRTAKI